MGNLITKTIMLLLYVISIFIGFVALFIDFREASAKEVIGQYKYGKYYHNVVSIQDWQKKIAEEIKMPFSTLEYARTIQTQECGDENGFCDNRIDCGPFQINQIHKTENAWCKKKIYEATFDGKDKNTGKWHTSEVTKAKKSGNWKRVLEIRDELYKSQLIWLWGRMKQQVETFEIPTDSFERVRQLCVYHNGSRTKREYGRKCILSYSILRKYNLSLKK